MSIIDNIKKDQLSARKSKNTVESTLLTTLLAESVIVGKNQGRETTDQETVAVIKKFVKNINEYISAVKGNDNETLNKLKTELDILSRYLPPQLTEDEMSVIVSNLISDDPTLNVGSIMKVMKERYDGRYDGKTLSSVAKGLL